LTQKGRERGGEGIAPTLSVDAKGNGEGTGDLTPTLSVDAEGERKGGIKERDFSLPNFFLISAK
jgi:hypothetical protein